MDGVLGPRSHRPAAASDEANSHFVLESHEAGLNQLLHGRHANVSANLPGSIEDLRLHPSAFDFELALSTIGEGQQSRVEMPGVLA